MILVAKDDLEKTNTAWAQGGIAAALDGADVVYALGTDEGDIPAGPTLIYQGSHGDRGAHRADKWAYTQASGG